MLQCSCLLFRNIIELGEQRKYSLLDKLDTILNRNAKTVLTYHRHKHTLDLKW